MKRHLFLQGEIGIGKSTLIRKAVLPYLNDAGGYFVQRIYLGENQKKYMGFAVKPLDNDKNYQLSISIDNLAEVKGLFLFCNTDGIWQQIPGAFAKAATDFLKNALLQRKKLIIMDELGGMELEDNLFSDMVFNVLDGTVPVLGVLKSFGNIEKLRKAAGGKFDVAIEKVLQVCNKIKNLREVDILTLTDKTNFAPEKRLKLFMERVFCCE
ncbi:MAG: nucleoside-triphosphatase [Tepidanaerobacteraceae bacterium]|jgi:nucleoside-triphosphatase|nr:nucleoside-triphosphatase [Tepidanaerobacteraceae bacterium]